MTNSKLDELVENGDITSYTYQNVDEDGNVGGKSKRRNTERLSITFPSGKVLVCDTFCSGCLENTVLTFDVQ